jgi:hypothetical protein
MMMMMMLVVVVVAGASREQLRQAQSRKVNKKERPKASNYGLCAITRSGLNPLSFVASSFPREYFHCCSLSHERDNRVVQCRLVSTTDWDRVQRPNNALAGEATKESTFQTLQHKGILMAALGSRGEVICVRDTDLEWKFPFLE